MINIMFMRITHVVPCSCFSRISLLSYCTVYVWHKLAINSTVDEQLCYFQCGTIMNNAAKNMSFDA